jgi:hypothetical protein
MTAERGEGSGLPWLACSLRGDRIGLLGIGEVD